MQITLAQKPHLNFLVDVFSEVRDPKFNLSLHLHPYFVYEKSKGSGKTAWTHRLVGAFSACADLIRTLNIMH